MNSRLRDNLRTAFVVSAGWLFADLLLALAMLFLTANTFAVVPPLPTPTPTPTFTPGVVHPTPTVQPLDLLNKQTIVVHNVDFASLTVDHPSQQAIDKLAAQIKAQVIKDGLQKQRAGLAIAYGVATDNSQINQAAGVADEVYNALTTLGKQGFVFFRDAKHYDSLFTLNHTSDCSDLSCVKIDVYLFTQ